VCLANGLLRQSDAHSHQKTFSACSRFEKFDERRYVDIVAAHTGVDSRCVYPDLGELFEQNRRITWFHDEPFGTTSVFAQWKVFELAASAGVKVMLDGQGADEQLAGYDSFLQARVRGLIGRGAWAELARELAALRETRKYTSSALFKLTASAALPIMLKRGLWRVVKGKRDAALGWIDLGVLDVSPELVGFRDQEDHSIRSLSIDQLVRSNLPKLLHWEDRDSMAHSLESRVPFLDYRLVEFSLGMPDAYKLRTGVTKRILRDAMQSVLPELIRNRTDKMGFVTPEEVWLREIGADQFRSALAQSILSSKRVIRSDARNLLDDMIAGRKAYSSEIWRIISFGCWMEVFNVDL
jgi:asparagine synthase (glutamine-hydrolysing)